MHKLSEHCWFSLYSPVPPASARAMAERTLSLAAAQQLALRKRMAARHRHAAMVGPVGGALEPGQMRGVPENATSADPSSTLRTISVLLLVPARAQTGAAPGTRCQ